MSFLAKIKRLFVRSVLPNTETQHRIDRMQYAMEQMPQADCPLKERFTPGLYYRECHFPKGAMIVTKIHKSEHPFVLIKGDVSVWIEGTGAVRMTAPVHGVTLPGTRRIIYAHEDSVWMTFHPTKETDTAKIEDQIIEKRDVGYQISKHIEAELQKELTS